MMANMADSRMDSPSLAQPREAVGASELFLQFQQQVARVAGPIRPVILIGERGTGKELAAARIHFLSPRWSRPFIKLNCAALSESVLESELFGHEAGAFTGAQQRREGRFESADGGTLFLDELGLMPLTVQEKLLRVVEYGVFERVGSSDSIEVNVRLVAATSVDLRSLVDQGKFKADLLDRLAFQVIHLPPLRAREGDVLLLANHFARRFAVELGLGWTPIFGRLAIAELERHDWPGNIRELRNVVERAVYLSDQAEITTIVIDPWIAPFDFRRPAETNTGSKPQMSPEYSPIDFDSAAANHEVRLLQEALKASRYNQREAARLLGLSYDRFRGLYRKYQATLERE